MIKQVTTETVDPGIAGAGLLWQAVLARTIEEWFSGPLRRQREAEQYLFHDNVDFPAVCESAGMNATCLREKLLKMRGKGRHDKGLKAA